MPLLELSAWQAELAAISWTLLDFCWQGALILLAYTAARTVWRTDPRARLHAGHVALLALATAPIVTLALRWPAATNGSTAHALAIEVSATAPGYISAGAQPAWMPWVVALWAGGVLMMAVRAMWQWHVLRQICKRARPLDDQWQRRLTDLGVRFGLMRPLLVLESSRISSPSLIGWLKPVILLPAEVMLRLPQAQIELLLAHELAHLRRYDHLANLLQVVIETALFYHPAVHWISRKVREDREQCCDDLVAEVCGARLDYARALLSIAEHQSHLPRLAIAASGGQLLARVERIVGAEQQTPRPVSERVMLGLVAGVTIFAGLQALPGADEALPMPWPISAITLDSSAIPAPLLGLRIGDFTMPQLQPTLHAPAGLAERAPTTVSALSITPSGTDDPTVPDFIPEWDVDTLPLPALSLAPQMDAMVGEQSLALSTDMRALQGAEQATIPQPTRTEAPAYPWTAERRGIEGSVQLSFGIDARGRVIDVRIESAEPAGVFEQAAERALQRWRFAPDAAGSGRQTRSFDFRLKKPTDACVVPSTGSRICRPVS